jgi:hypothetical protein
MHISVYVVLADGTERFCETKSAGKKSAKGNFARKHNLKRHLESNKCRRKVNV